MKSGINVESEKMCIPATIIQFSFWSLNMKIRVEKKKVFQIRNDVKLLLFADDMILYIENSKLITRKVLELINEFGKLAGFKVNSLSSAFLHTKNER